MPGKLILPKLRYPRWSKGYKRSLARSPCFSEGFPYSSSASSSETNHNPRSHWFLFLLINPLFLHPFFSLAHTSPWPDPIRRSPPFFRILPQPRTQNFRIFYNFRQLFYRPRKKYGIFHPDFVHNPQTGAAPVSVPQARLNAELNRLAQWSALYYAKPQKNKLPQSLQSTMQTKILKFLFLGSVKLECRSFCSYPY